MNAQRTSLLQQSIEEKHKKLDEAKQSVVMPQCADDNDMASCYENTLVNILLMQHAGKRLRHLEQNMVSIEHRTRALCLDCGEEISPRRLEALPDAVRCIACQEAWEEERMHAPVWEDTLDSLYPDFRENAPRM